MSSRMARISYGRRSARVLGDIVESLGRSIPVGQATCRLAIVTPNAYRKFSGVRSWRAKLWLDHQYGLCRAPQPRHPPVRGGDRTPSQYALPGRSRLTGSTGVVPGLSQFRGAPCESAAAIADTGGHQRLWLSEIVAAVHTGDGSRLDGSRVVAQGGAVLPGTTMAPPADGL